MPRPSAPTRRRRLVEGAARLHGVLDLELTDEARALLPGLLH
jgi:hypothetical protein